jgi:hypothetical protein
MQYPAGRNGSFAVPGSVIAIGDYAFRNCSGLTGVSIPGSVARIGYGSFSYCTGLSGLIISEGVASILGTAFYGCSMLTRAHFLGNAPEMGADVFTNCAAEFTVFYTAGSTGFTAPKWHGYSAARAAGGACPAQNVMGMDHPYLQNLRAFRDGSLAQSVTGRKIICMYYSNADSINAALESSPSLRAVAWKFFEAVARLQSRRE